MSKRLIAWSGALLAVSFSVQRATAVDVIPIGAGWRYLNPLTEAEAPGTLDPTFEANWFKPNFNVNGPNKFQGPSPEPFARADVGSTDNRIEAFTAADTDFIRAPGTLITLPATGARSTSYFRHDFTTTAAKSGLALEYLVDDGARFFLDGQEILSYQCCVGLPAGTPAPFGSRATTLGNEKLYSFRPVLAGETLAAGNHTLAVAVYQNGTSSNDMAFSARLTDGFLYDPLVDLGETYRYFEGFEEPSDDPLAWTQAGFDDAAWETGEEGFGYDTDTATNALPLIKTELEDMITSYSSFYLRKEFTVSDPSKYGKLELTMDYDDGFIAYINGEEVMRASVDGEVGAPVAVDALGLSHESTNASGAPGEIFSISLADFPNLLKAGGDNVLAIHGLNTTLDSTDFLLAQISLAGLAADAVGIPGDFDGNGLLESADIDELTRQSASGANDAAYDLNSDGAVDSGDISVWVKDLKNSWIGDVNLNGEFSSGDLVPLFVAGTYENPAAPATWSTGDFNGNGLFTTSDLVVALSDGGYEVGPRAAVSAVPEPASLVLALLASTALVGRARRRV